jgi:lipid-A-disaccharide synthase
MKFALVAGEASGDTLGAALMLALRQRHPGAEFIGVGGPKMQALGLTMLAHAEELAVMGLTEVLAHLPRLLALRSRLRRELLAGKPDVFVGIDAPEFNLGLARWLKRRGLKTVQYVSPQVWAWRQGRVRTMGQAVDLVLCLLPFEPDFYQANQLRAEFVGHPLADEIPLVIDRQGARSALGVPAAAKVLAVLPGSRLGEVSRLGADFAAAAAQFVAAQAPGVRTVVLVPLVNDSVRTLFTEQARVAAIAAEVRLLDGQAQRALAAADVVLVASGTATLETLLCKRPMVVAYRLGAVTAFLLLGERRVPEFFQEQVRPAALAAALAQEIADPARVQDLERRFLGQHQRLRCGGAERAAAAILKLLG